MSTTDLPGSNPANGDDLHAGCWAEHKDKSLIVVGGTENGTVVYEIFDVATDPPVAYRSAMPEVDFKKQFQAFSKNKDWTWHDKTPFPWSRVMELGEKPGGRFASAGGLMTAARRVAESLGLRGTKLNADEFADLSPRQRAEAMIKRMQGMLDDLPE